MTRLVPHAAEDGDRPGAKPLSRALNELDHVVTDPRSQFHFRTRRSLTRAAEDGLREHLPALSAQHGDRGCLFDVQRDILDRSLPESRSLAVSREFVSIPR